MIYLAIRRHVEEYAGFTRQSRVAESRSRPIAGEKICHFKISTAIGSLTILRLESFVFLRVTSVSESSRRGGSRGNNARNLFSRDAKCAVVSPSVPCCCPFEKKKKKNSSRTPRRGTAAASSHCSSRRDMGPAISERIDGQSMIRRDTGRPITSRSHYVFEK